MGETRLRIVEAAVLLHGSVGPSRTTIAGIAQQAGVTRETVYRHFADEDSLYEACSSHWLAKQAPPDPASWSGTPDLDLRVRSGLADVYRFYRSGEEMLTRIYRDFSSMPESRQRSVAETQRLLADLLLQGSPGIPPGRPQAARARQPGDRRSRAAARHAVSFWTWRSLCVEQGLPDREAVEMMADLVVGCARAARAR